MRLRLVFILSIGLWSCSKTVDNKSLSGISDSAITTTVDTSSQILTVDTTRFDYESYFKLESYLTKDNIENIKLEIIDFDCAILIYPTVEQIDEMKKEYGEEDFYTVADDNSWYQGQAIGIIDSVGVKKTTARGQFLRLQGKQATWDLDIRKKNLPTWNLIFFKTDKEPKIVSTVDLTVDEVKEYFNK
jgi:hypothetical protein